VLCPRLVLEFVLQLALELAAAAEPCAAEPPTAATPAPRILQLVVLELLCPAPDLRA
jgi:hypothetical protein